MNRNVFDEISQQLSRLLPQASALGEEARQNLAAALQRSMERLDLPTREEFDQQREALERAQVRIAELEGAVAALETLLHQNGADAEKRPGL